MIWYGVIVFKGQMIAEYFGTAGTSRFLDRDRMAGLFILRR
jgi:hypothetical protein